MANQSVPSAAKFIPTIPTSSNTLSTSTPYKPSIFPVTSATSNSKLNNISRYICYRCMASEKERAILFINRHRLWHNSCNKLPIPVTLTNSTHLPTVGPMTKIDTSPGPPNRWATNEEQRFFASSRLSFDWRETARGKLRQITRIVRLEFIVVNTCGFGQISSVLCRKRRCQSSLGLIQCNSV